MKALAKCLWAATGLLLAGCGRDAEVLDRFSRSYTSFLDAEGDASIASYVPVIRSEDNPNNPFWKHLRAALDAASSAARVQSASAGIADYDRVVDPYLDHFAELVGNLDKSVLGLIEIANAIHDREYRNDALEVAKSAREAQGDLATICHLLVKRFSVQRKVMEGIVANGGNLVAVIGSDPEASRDAAGLTRTIEECRTSLTSAERKYRDAFSALKGKAGLKQYAAKYER
ncbi:MAG: hypothetical protein ABSG26_25980 [Bryobacteraceae bacterium]|jgi:hypothetical protein